MDQDARDLLVNVVLPVIVVFLALVAVIGLLNGGLAFTTGYRVAEVCYGGKLPEIKVVEVRRFGEDIVVCTSDNVREAIEIINILKEEKN